MREYELLVLAPPPYGPRPLHNRLLSIWRRRLSGQPVDQFGGHSAVTRSIVHGLRRQGDLRWKFATSYRKETAEVIHILAHPDFVKVGLVAKNEGRCDRLIVGPNVSGLPHQNGAIQARPEIDRVLVPSAHVLSTYEADVPALTGRIRVWPAGVDESYWSPTVDRQSRTRILVYIKKWAPADVRPVIDLLKSSGLEVTEIAYGDYRARDYHKALSQARAAVFLADNESQGLAMFEAWSMDVPTFVHKGSSPFPAPYLTDATGALWDEVDELGPLIANAHEYRPREWVLSNATDAISAQILLNIAGLRPHPLTKDESKSRDPAHP